MRRLIWGFAGRTYHIVGNLMSQLISNVLFGPSSASILCVRAIETTGASPALQYAISDNILK